MKNILKAEVIDQSIKKLPDTEWHVACSSSGSLTPQDEAREQPFPFPIVGFMRHEPGGGCIAHSHPGPQCFYVTAGEALFQVGEEESRVGVGDLVLVPPDVPHQYKVEGDSIFTCMIIEGSLEGLTQHTNYPAITYPEILEKTVGKGEVDKDKIKRELGWDVTVVSECVERPRRDNGEG